MLIEVMVDGPNSLMNFWGKNWMWKIIDKLVEIITLRYLNELTHSSWKPFKKRGEGGSIRQRLM